MVIGLDAGGPGRFSPETRGRDLVALEDAG
jgi:hypothetical protein